jgi:hypothetical protein
VYAVEGTTGFLRWQYRTGGTTSQSPAIGVDGTVYAPSEDGALYALHGTTGTVVWKFPTPDGGSPTAPAVDDDNGIIVVGSYNDHVYCVRIRDGMLLWTAATGWHVATQPALWGGLVFVGSMDKSVYALQRDTGAQVWNYTTDAYIRCSAAVDSNGVVFVGSYDHNLCVQRAQCGFVVCCLSTCTAHNLFSLPCRMVGCGAAHGSLCTFALHFARVLDDLPRYSFEGSSGDLRWSFSTGGLLGAAPALTNTGLVIVGQWDGDVWAVNATTGARDALVAALHPSRRHGMPLLSQRHTRRCFAWSKAAKCRTLDKDRGLLRDADTFTAPPTTTPPLFCTPAYALRPFPLVLCAV